MMIRTMNRTLTHNEMIMVIMLKPMVMMETNIGRSIMMIMMLSIMVNTI